MCLTIRRTCSGSCGGTGSCPTGPTLRTSSSPQRISSTKIWPGSGSTSKLGGVVNSKALALGAVTAAALTTAAVADEEPKRGGILTYMIPADAPPSFDAHREETYATIHSAAPFYS